MKRQHVPVGLAALAALVALGACQQHPPPAPPDTRAADEKAIRAEVAEWDKAAIAKDLDKTISFYAPDASIFPPNAPIATTPEQRRQLWSQLLSTPGMTVSFATTKVEVARSGDIAYETGTYQLTSTDKKGKTTTSKGKYVVVWKKQPDGKWKAAADIWNPDQ